MSSHWATKYIGIPWKCGMSGPDSYDCWGFAVMIEREHFQRQLPEIAGRQTDSLNAARTIENHEERDNWYQVTKPVDGDLVLMARRNVPVHIGVWIKTNLVGGVLHCLEKSGVVFSDVRSLQSIGFGGLMYFHPKD